MSKACFAAVAAVFLLAGAQPALAADKPADKSSDVQSYADATKGLARQDGLLPVFVDKAKGRILLSLPAPDADGVSGRFLYLTALRTGIGSASIGLDRGMLGQTQVLAFRRIGRKVLAEYENPRFRATDAPMDEQAAAAGSFAYSTVWAGEVVADGPDGGVLVDISGFLTRDVMGAADSLKQGETDAFKLVTELSIADVGAVRVFPENLEFEARQTFAADKPGAEVRNIAPDPKLVSVVVRHSLVKLPGPGYQPRRFDFRAGGFATQVVDYAAPLGQDVVYELANRFRLEKLDPSAPRSRVKKPIVFYVDRAAPEPIRSALVDGVGWWAKAFEEAGYIDAFRVDVLPEGADPLDVRYNVVNWIDRATRGWSMGVTVTDPRTGEIVKGAVLLGSLRVRQDMLIFEGLVGADKVGTGGPDDPIVASLARIRQLGAHEVGHALGFAHNFAGSTQGRASVMDYPAPRLKLTNGRIDLSDAYGVGVGRWDSFIVDWLYGAAPDGPAGAAALDAKVRAAQAQGLRYVTDSDARADGAAQPWGSLWDDTADPSAELRRMMQVRRAAIDNFSAAALRPGEAAANLRRKYVPVYLLHRYQIDAASKLVAGVAYSYAVNGDPSPGGAVVPAAQQRDALDAVLTTLAPAQLDTPERLIPLLSAAYSGSSDRQFDIEVFASAGGSVFDPLVAAETAAGMSIGVLVAPTRLNRLVDQHRRDPANLGVEEVLSRLSATAFAPAAGRLAEIQRRVQTRLVIDLARAARDPDVSPAAVAEIEARLGAITAQLKAAPGADGAERAHRARLALLLTDRKEMERVLARPKLTPEVPPGMPIGNDGA
jgi:uncharacterized protein DUF4953/uncharacterized protein DUF5117